MQDDEGEATTSEERANLSTVRARLQDKRKERKKYDEEDTEEQDPQQIFLEHLSKEERERAYVGWCGGILMWDVVTAKACARSRRN